MPVNFIHRTLIPSILGLSTLVVTACDEPDVSSNIDLDDEQLMSRSHEIDCDLWLQDRPLQHTAPDHVDIGLDFAELAYHDGFAGARACEQTSYDEEPDGAWVIHHAAPGDLTWELGLRSGDRNVEVRCLDPETGLPAGEWFPVAFPQISVESLLESYDCREFEVRAESVHGPKKTTVHLAP